jgi:hypothetical protein
MPREIEHRTQNLAADGIHLCRGRDRSLLCSDFFLLGFGHGFPQRSKAATKQAFNPQISQITQILQIINKNNSKSIGFHDLPSKN